MKNTFSKRVDESQAALDSAAKDRPWLLTVFSVPDKLGGLMERLGFRPTKNNPNHWWQTFDSLKPNEKGRAAAIRSQLLDQRLRGKWKQIARKPPFTPHYQPRHPGGDFGGALNARPISGSWRRRKKPL